MTKRGVVLLFLAAASLTGLAIAQSSEVRSSSSKSGSDPLQAATKPLTPKSTMPAQRKSSPVTLPNGLIGSRNTTAELTHLERQKIKTGGSTTLGGPAKVPPLKTAETSAGGPAINYKYQKPVAGMTASNPGANSKNSSTPRVKKN
jgi:hypothetical protein